MGKPTIKSFSRGKRIMKGGNTVFNFLPIYAKSAMMVANGLLPYLRSEYGNEVLEFFTVDKCV